MRSLFKSLICIQNGRLPCECVCGCTNRRRTDIRVENLNLMSLSNFLSMGLRSRPGSALAGALYTLGSTCRDLIALTTFPSSMVYVNKSFPGGSGISSSFAVTVKIVLPVLMSCNQWKVIFVVFFFACLSVFLSVWQSVCFDVKGWDLTTTYSHLSRSARISRRDYALIHTLNCVPFRKLLAAATFLQLMDISVAIVTRFNYIQQTALDF